MLRSLIKRLLLIGLVAELSLAVGQVGLLAHDATNLDHTAWFTVRNGSGLLWLQPDLGAGQNVIGSTNAADTASYNLRFQGFGGSNMTHAVFAANFLQATGVANEQAYIGGDGFGSNVQLGSLNPAITNVGIWNQATNSRMNLFVKDLVAEGVKRFVQAHPTDPTKEINYAALEGGEADTYFRGTARLVNGEAVIALPEHFGLVTNDQGLTFQLTPLGEWLQLYVMQKSTKQIIIRESSGKSGQFDYWVQGVRKGYENYQVIRERTR